jgi:hypothetical protein
MMHALPSERTLKAKLSKAYAIVYNAVTEPIETKSLIFSSR